MYGTETGTKKEDSEMNQNTMVLETNNGATRCVAICPSRASAVDIAELLEQQARENHSHAQFRTRDADVDDVRSTLMV